MPAAAAVTVAVALASAAAGRNSQPTLHSQPVEADLPIYLPLQEQIARELLAKDASFPGLFFLPRLGHLYRREVS